MTITAVVSDFFHIHAANAAIATQNVTFVVGASETLECETSEETVNWIVYSPTRRRISYENQLLPSAVDKYLLDGPDLIVNNVTEQDAGEYHCEVPRNAFIFHVVTVESQSKYISKSTDNSC